MSVNRNTGALIKKDYYNHKIYIKKGRYQIIEVD